MSGRRKPDLSNPVGIRFPMEMQERIKALASLRHTTLSEIVVHSCDLALPILEDEERSIRARMAAARKNSRT